MNETPPVRNTLFPFAQKKCHLLAMQQLHHSQHFSVRADLRQFSGARTEFEFEKQKNVRVKNLA
jgi:hypothetical protein